VSLDGGQGCLHGEAGVQDESVTQIDGAVYRDYALDMAQRRHTQYHLNISITRQVL
jgi:hypothetical protein